MKIAISVVLALFLVGCGDDASKSSESVEAPTQEVQAVAQGADSVADEPTKEDAVNDMSDSMQDAADDMMDSAKDAATDMADNMKDSSDEMSESMSDATEDMADAASDTAESMADAMTGMMPGDSSVSGKEIFKVCSTCHGANAEKSALGKSKIIRGWDMIKIENALQGYKDGTYGGPMKAVMKGQVSKLDSEEIEAVAEYISNL